MTDRLAERRINTMLFYGTILLVTYLVYLLLMPFLKALVWACVLAALFYPLQRRFRSRMGKTSAASVNTFIVTALIVVPSILVMVSFVREATQAVKWVQEALETGGIQGIQQASDWVQQRVLGGQRADVEQLAKQAAGWLGGAVASQAGAVLRNLFGVGIDLVVMLFALFFFFRDGDVIMAATRRVLPFELRERERMIAEASELARASIRSGLIVAAVQGFIGGVTFALLGLGAPVFWGVIMAFFALLPVAGAWVVWAPAAVWLLINGNVARALTLIGIGAGVVGLVDNFLRPALLSGSTRMNGLLVFVGLLGGMAAFGLLGLVLGPIILATAIGLLNAYTTTDSPRGPTLELEPAARGTREQGPR